MAEKQAPYATTWMEMSMKLFMWTLKMMDDYPIGFVLCYLAFMYLLIRWGLWKWAAIFGAIYMCLYLAPHKHIADVESEFSTLKEELEIVVEENGSDEETIP